MSKPVASIDNLTDPGQPLVHGDRIRTNYTDGTYIESYYESLSITPGTTTAGVPQGIRIIATKSWYRRLTQAERINLRTTDNEDINDLREDLQRAPTVDMDDPELLASLQIIGVPAPRITELLADGTEEERYVNVVT
jgi:hypothetical protein